MIWLPFDLHPEYPPGGIPRADLIARYGEDSIVRLRAAFAAEGLPYNPHPEVVPNTRLALELGEQARAEGVHDPYHERLMEAYWTEGVDLSQRAALEELALAAGVSAEGIARALDERAWGADVDGWTRQAHAIGVNGVPSFLIARRLLVVGAQPREVLADALAQALEAE